MPVKIKRGSSRLVHAELVIVDGIEFWSRPRIPDIEPDATDVYHLNGYQERIDGVSEEKYKRQDWWWVLAHRNDFRSLPGDVIPGKSTIVPRASLVRKALF